MASFSMALFEDTLQRQRARRSLESRSHNGRDTLITSPSPPSSSFWEGTTSSRSTPLVSIPVSARFPRAPPPSPILNGTDIPTRSHRSSIAPPGYSELSRQRYPMKNPAAAPPYSPYRPSGLFEDPSRDPEVWSLAAPTLTSFSRDPDVWSLAASTLTPTVTTNEASPNRADEGGSSSPRGSIQRIRTAVYTFIRFILPPFLLLAPAIGFYYWFYQMGGFFPESASKYYQDHALYHDYDHHPSSGTKWSLVAIVYSFLGAVANLFILMWWLEPLRVCKKSSPEDTEGNLRSRVVVGDGARAMIALTLFILIIFLVLGVLLFGILELVTLVTVKAKEFPDMEPESTRYYSSLRYLPWMSGGNW